ncbi:MAG: hypothetical protein ACFFCS_04460 [Candidatus Hodarchaeota archaeon]
MPSRRIAIHRGNAWLLGILAIATILTGYINARNWFITDLRVVGLNFWTAVHVMLEWFFIGSFIVHIILSSLFSKIKWRKLFSAIRNKGASSYQYLRLLQEISKWTILILAIINILTGLTWYPWFVSLTANILEFSPHVRLDEAFTIAIIFHVAIGALINLKRRKIKVKPKRVLSNTLIIVLAVSMSSYVIYLEILKYMPIQPSVFIEDTQYSFNPDEITTSVRQDIFKPGKFSMFDVLVHLDDKGTIDLVYHFNTSMNTYVIDSLNGETNWWYKAHYDGGSEERNVYRMDHYLWKRDSFLKLEKINTAKLDRIYETFMNETSRFIGNGNITIIPTVTIIFKNGSSLIFNDVNVIPYGLRNDTFHSNVTTAIDVILTLNESGQITCDLQWYNALGSADVVYSYWVNGINGESTEGRCGFVYEEGDDIFGYTLGNYIEVPADTRVINSPEYETWFWKCK